VDGLVEFARRTVVPVLIVGLALGVAAVLGKRHRIAFTTLAVTALMLGVAVYVYYVLNSR
jgi:hypothetical protein